MKPTAIFTVGVVALAVLAGGGAIQATDLSATLSTKPGPGDSGQESFAHPLQYLLEDGWEVIAPDVMRRELEDGRIETWASGVRGLVWAVQSLADELVVMERDYRQAPSDELLEAIATHNELLEDARAKLDSALREGGSSLQPKLLPDPGCDVSWGYHAYAYPGATSQADAYFSNTCSYTASTYAYAYVSTTTNGVTNTASQTDPSGPGANVSSYAYKSLPGTADSCYSYARAYVNSPFGFFETSDSDSRCDPLQVYISGTTYVYVPYSCKTYTWTANPSGGTGSYTNYHWTYNGSTVGGNSSTYSRTYCATLFWTYRTDTIGVTVTDSGGATASDTHNVTVELGPADPCIEPYSAEVGAQAQQQLPQPCPY